MTTTRRTTSTLVAGGLAAALALAGCGTEQAGSGGSGLPPLRIGAASGLAQADSAKGGSDFQLDGTLPDGPRSAPVARFGDGPGEDDVRALAAALGLGTDLERRDHGWLVEDRAGVLRVRSDASGLWAFSRSADDCPSYSIDIDSAGGAGGGAVSCARAVDTAGTTSDAPSAPSSADALAAAQPVLDAAGVDADARALGDNGLGSRTVAADPVVAGLATVGLRTFVDVDADGVSGAMGWLGDAVAGDEYPLLAAKAAFDRLAAMPRPLPAIGCPEVSPGSDVEMPDICGEPQPVVVTGATLGLMLAWEGSDPVLVPSWHFAVQGWDEPLAVVAVEDRYLADPEPSGGGASSEPSPGTGGGVEPGEPGTDEPVAPPTDPGLSPEPVPSDPGTPVVPPGEPSGVAIEKASVSSDGRTLTLVGWGGVCAEYSAIADEAPDAVKVQIVGRSTLGPDEACIEIAKQIEVTVELDAPLAGRTVVDATTGATVRV